jgi:hypothetical protein
VLPACKSADCLRYCRLLHVYNICGRELTQQGIGVGILWEFDCWLVLGIVQAVLRSGESTSVLSTSAIGACASVIAGALELLELYPYLGIDGRQ